MNGFPTDIIKLPFNKALNALVQRGRVDGKYATLIV